MHYHKFLPLQIVNLAVLAHTRAQSGRERNHLFLPLVFSLDFGGTPTRLPAVFVHRQKHRLQRLHRHQQIVDQKPNGTLVAAAQKCDERKSVKSAQWVIRHENEAAFSRNAVGVLHLGGDVEVVESLVGSVHTVFSAHALKNLVQFALMNDALQPASEQAWDKAIVARQALPHQLIYIYHQWFVVHFQIHD